MRAAMSCKNTLIWPIVDFAIETGMRRSEILSLRWGNVSTAELLEPPSDTKNELKRDAPPTLKETGNSKPPSAKRECIPNLWLRRKAYMGSVGKTLSSIFKVLESLSFYKKALEIKPHAGASINYNYITALVSIGEYEEGKRIEM